MSSPHMLLNVLLVLKELLLLELGDTGCLDLEFLDTFQNLHAVKSNCDAKI